MTTILLNEKDFKSIKKCCDESVDRSDSYLPPPPSYPALLFYDYYECNNNRTTMMWEYLSLNEVKDIEQTMSREALKTNR